MKKVIGTLVIAVFLGGMMGCAKKSGEVLDDSRGADQSGVPGGGGTVDPVDLDNSETSLSATTAMLNQFFFQSPLTNPTNKRFAMSIGNDGSGGYAGDIRISVDDNGSTRTAVLSTTHPLWTGVADASNNRWFNCSSGCQDPVSGVNHAGQSVWHGQFQDRYGAIVIVIDGGLSEGDGLPSTLVSGSIWFQNFTQPMPPYNQYQGPLKMCWGITAGPYACQTFLSGGVVSTTSQLYPTTYNPANSTTPYRGPYKKLGSFSSMVRSAVFTD